MLHPRKSSPPCFKPDSRRIMVKSNSLLRPGSSTTCIGYEAGLQRCSSDATTLTFLGTELDTVQQTCRLLVDKLIGLRALITALIKRSKVMLRELQQLVGHLNFACQVVAPSRAFLRRLSAAMSGLWWPDHRTRITQGMRQDLRVWLQF